MLYVWFFSGIQGMEMNIVTVYDIQNKFIAYSAPYPDVIDVMCEWGSLYILAGDRKVYSYNTCVGWVGCGCAYSTL